MASALALRDCHTHLLISAGIGWAGTLSGRRAGVSKTGSLAPGLLGSWARAGDRAWSRRFFVFPRRWDRVVDASSALGAYQETAALARAGQEPKRIPSCPGYPGGLVRPMWELSRRTAGVDCLAIAAVSSTSKLCHVPQLSCRAGRGPQPPCGLLPRYLCSPPRYLAGRRMTRVPR